MDDADGPPALRALQPSLLTVRCRFLPLLPMLLMLLLLLVVLLLLQTDHQLRTGLERNEKMAKKALWRARVSG
jgi:hypothetical protein